MFLVIVALNVLDAVSINQIAYILHFHDGYKNAKILKWHYFHIAKLH